MLLRLAKSLNNQIKFAEIVRDGRNRGHQPIVDASVSCRLHLKGTIACKVRVSESIKLAELGKRFKFLAK